MSARTPEQSSPPPGRDSAYNVWTADRKSSFFVDETASCSRAVCLYDMHIRKWKLQIIIIIIIIIL